MKQGCVIGQVCPAENYSVSFSNKTRKQGPDLRRENSSQAANHDNVASSYGCDRRTASIVDTPTNEPATRSKAGNSIQKDGPILGIGVGREAKYRESDDGARQNASHEDASLVHAIA
jgi:hypothetical protein